VFIILQVWFSSTKRISRRDVRYVIAYVTSGRKSRRLNRLLETKTISVDPILGALTDSGELIYPPVVAGRANIDDVRKIMGETAQIRHTLEPPIKYVLCKASSLADLITKTHALENLQGV
jgi:hypothetical protein